MTEKDEIFVTTAIEIKALVRKKIIKENKSNNYCISLMQNFIMFVRFKHRMEYLLLESRENTIRNEQRLMINKFQLGKIISHVLFITAMHHR